MNNEEEERRIKKIIEVNKSRNEIETKDKMIQGKHIPTVMEIKTYMMIDHSELLLFRNKKNWDIKKQKKEIEKFLKENNLDMAKSKMENLIRQEDHIIVIDILSPILEILKARVDYIGPSTQCPSDLRKNYIQ